MRLLVTRPREAAEQTATLLRARGHEVVVAPLLDIRISGDDEIALDGVQAILVTSANGIRALAQRTQRRDLPVFAVGPQSAEAARAVGFAETRHSDGDAAALARAVPQWARPEAGALFHPAGRQTSGVLAEQLTAAGFTVRSQTVYEVQASRRFPPSAAAAIATGELDAVLLFSPQSARIFVDAVRASGVEPACLHLAALCISAATAAALDGLAFATVRVAERPDQDGVLGLLN